MTQVWFQRSRGGGVRAVLAMALIAVAGCNTQSVEDRARERAEEIVKSMDETETVALEQKVDPAVVTEVQRNLTAIHVRMEADSYPIRMPSRCGQIQIEDQIYAVPPDCGCGEYQGEVNGKIDAITINAVQAFQRAAGLKDTGVITDDTRRKLAESVEQAKKLNVASGGGKPPLTCTTDAPS